VFTADKVHDVQAVAASVRRVMRMLAFAAVLAVGEAEQIAAAEAALSAAEQLAFRSELLLRPVPASLLAQVSEGITGAKVWADNASGCVPPPRSFPPYLPSPLLHHLLAVTSLLLFAPTFLLIPAPSPRLAPSQPVS
jgi:hypothetical protein